MAENFKYLCSTISADGSLDEAIDTRVRKASQAPGGLRLRVLNHHRPRLPTKLLVYRAVVLSSLLYGSETWKPYRRRIIIKGLEAFHMRTAASGPCSTSTGKTK